MDIPSFLNCDVELGNGEDNHQNNQEVLQSLAPNNRSSLLPCLPMIRLTSLGSSLVTH